MKRARRPRPVEGEWYAVPLPDGSFALLVVAFFDGGHFAGFYFGPPAPSKDDLRQRPGVDPENAVLVALTEMSGITTGRWPALGRRSDDVESWELPEFVGKEGSTDEYLYRLEPRQYSWYTSRRRRPPDDSDDRRGGFGFYPHVGVEARLAKRLGVEGSGQHA